MNVARYDNYMLINSYLTFFLLAFCFFSMSTLLQLGVYEIWKEFCTRKLGDQYPLFPFQEVGGILLSACFENESEVGVGRGTPGCDI